MPKLTYQQKLDALAYRFYQGGTWEPQAGDFYTTSRADLELYQVVSVEGGIVRTRFTEGSDAVSEWPQDEFLTGGFGPKRVFVPPWVITAQPAQVDRRHEFVPNKKYPWFCAHCGYAPHEPLAHIQPDPTPDANGGDRG